MLGKKLGSVLSSSFGAIKPKRKEVTMRRMGVFLGIAALVVAIAAIGARPGSDTRKVDELSHYRVLNKAGIPHQINYQGYLTDNAGNAITDTLGMTFSIWDDPNVGACLWDDLQPEVAVIDGLFNVLLGSVTPIPSSVFSNPACWLQTVIEGEILSPRKELVSIGYAYRADTADHATNAIHANWADNSEHAIYADTAAWAAGTGPVIYADTAGFAYKADSANYAAGMSVPCTLSGSVSFPNAILTVEDTGAGIGIKVTNAGDDGVYVDSAGDDGVHVGSVGWYGVYVADAGVYGVCVGNAGWDGVYVGSAGDDGVSVDSAGGDGVYVGNAGWDGVRATGKRRGGVFYNDSTGINHPALQAKNCATNGSDGRIANLYSANYLRFHFDCDGTAYADVGWSTFKKNGKGEYESYSAVESPYKEIIAHGTGKLVNGQVYISFDNSFSEFVSSDVPTQITVTPKSGTGLYVPERSTRGFTVKSWGGDPNCEFDWLAIGREKGHEQRTVLHNLDEEMRLAALEEERERAEHERKLAESEREHELKRQRIEERREEGGERRERRREKREKESE